MTVTAIIVVIVVILQQQPLQFVPPPFEFERPLVVLVKIFVQPHEIVVYQVTKGHPDRHPDRPPPDAQSVLDVPRRLPRRLVAPGLPDKVLEDLGDGVCLFAGPRRVLDVPDQVEGGADDGGQRGRGHVGPPLLFRGQLQQILELQSQEGIGSSETQIPQDGGCQAVCERTEASLAEHFHRFF